MLDRRCIRYVILLSCAVVMGCATQLPGADSGVAKQARTLIGQNIQVAIANYGKPQMVLPKQLLFSKIPGASAEYDWNDFRPSNTSSFVKTGSAYVGSEIIGTTQGGAGIAPVPIYQDQYAATGYYKRDTDGCVLKITTDDKGTILDTVVWGNICR
ncbi:hypothetical protein [Dyella silvatica]|uniref:hypothetical protein n=1 Tax=Dyella silvatica TaxID=2992128 RepID=UPI00224ECC9E|nr:hypothetical protein [Dyella silvatica]